MKKIATLFFFFIWIVFLFPKEASISVFEESNENEGQFSYFDIYPKSITTQNFALQFEGYQVIQIMPKMNPLLEKQIKIELENYSFTDDTIENNIYNFTKKYLAILEKHGFSKEKSSISIRGIPIQKVTLFTTLKEYKKLVREVE